MELSKDRSDLDTFHYVKSLSELGIHVYKDGDKLKYKALKNHLDERVINEIRLRKEEILEYLEGSASSEVSLSPLQLAYMTGQSSARNLSRVNAHYYIEYTKKNIDQNRLEDCLNVIIQNNDALRLVILAEGKALILNHVPLYRIQTYDYSDEDTRAVHRNNLSRKKYEPETWPMFTFAVGKGRETDVLHISFDCSVLDAWSSATMIRMLFNMYHNKPVHFSKFSYKEYMSELVKYKIANRLLLEEADEYWSEAVQTMPQSPPVNTKKRLNQAEQLTFVRKEYKFDRGITERLNETARKSGVTLTSILITIYMRILSELCNYQDIAINTTLFGKMPVAKDLDNLIGEFTNIGLIRYERNDRSFLENIKRTQEQILYLLKFRLYDGINITNKLYGRDDAYEGHLFVVTCMIGETYDSKADDFLETYSISQTPQVLVDHHIRLIDGGIKISFDYVDELIDGQDIAAIIRRYVSCVGQLGKETVSIKGES